MIVAWLDSGHENHRESMRALVDLAGRETGECRLLMDNGDAAPTPGLQHGIEQGSPVLETSVESALGNAQSFGHDLDAHALDAALGEFGERGLDPFVRPIRHAARHLVIRHRIVRVATA